MADHIKIRPAAGTWVVRAGGAVLGETTAALELIEGDYAPVIYVPHEDIAMAFLDPSETTSTCPTRSSQLLFDYRQKRCNKGCCLACETH